MSEGGQRPCACKGRVRGRGGRLKGGERGARRERKECEAAKERKAGCCFCLSACFDWVHFLMSCPRWLGGLLITRIKGRGAGRLLRCHPHHPLTRL